MGLLTVNAADTRFLTGYRPAWAAVLLANDSFLHHLYDLRIPLEYCSTGNVQT